MSRNPVRFVPTNGTGDCLAVFNWPSLKLYHSFGESATPISLMRFQHLSAISVRTQLSTCFPVSWLIGYLEELQGLAKSSQGQAFVPPSQRATGNNLPNCGHCRHYSFLLSMTPLTRESGDDKAFHVGAAPTPSSAAWWAVFAHRLPPNLASL